MPFEPCLIPGHPLWEVFHESSKWGTEDFQEVARRSRRSSRHSNVTSSEYSRTPTMALPDPTGESRLTARLHDVLSRRRSAREFASVAIQWEEVAAILWAASGAVSGDAYRKHARTAPSAGACYPIDLYFYLPVARGGRSSGPYRYHPEPHAVSLLPTGLPLPTLRAAVAYPDLVERCGLLIFLAAVFSRTTVKYGARGYRFALIEAGHIGQNIYLAATALGLGAVAIGGWDDTTVDRSLGLDGVRASVLYTVALGSIRE
jgi:SagB-type dehydrogenase family enzyme